MIIREALIEDIPALNILVNSAYRGESSRKGWTTEADLLEGIRTSEESLTTMLNSRDAVILVITNGPKVQGCVYLEKQGNIMYMGMLAVDPPLQAHGLGNILISASEKRALKEGCIKMQITVITHRETLIEYYMRRGFFDTGTRQPFPTDSAFSKPKQPLQFMVMEKLL